MAARRHLAGLAACGALLLAACAGPAVDAQGAASSLDELVAAVVTRLAPAMDGDGFVVSSLEGDGAGTLLDGALVERLSAALDASSPELVNVAGAERRSVLLAAHAAQLDELYDDRAVPELGRWTGFRWVVTPRLLARDRVGELTVVATDLHSGATTRVRERLALGSVQDLLARRAPAPAAGTAASFGVELGWRVGQAPGVPPASIDPSALRVGPGATLRLTLRADRDLHVTVFARGSSGAGLVVFPHGAQPSTLVEAGQSVSVPPPDVLPFLFEGPSGTETFYVVLDPRPLDNHAGLAPLLGAPRLPLREGRLFITPDRFVDDVTSARWARDLDSLAQDPFGSPRAPSRDPLLTLGEDGASAVARSGLVLGEGLTVVRLTIEQLPPDATAE